MDIREVTNAQSLEEMFPQVDNHAARIERIEQAIWAIAVHQTIGADAINGVIEREVESQLEDKADTIKDNLKHDIERELMRKLEVEVGDAVDIAIQEERLVSDDELERKTDRADVVEVIEEEVPDMIEKRVVSEKWIETVIDRAFNADNRMSKMQRDVVDSFRAASIASASADRAITVATRATAIIRSLTAMTFWDRLMWLFTGTIHKELLEATLKAEQDVE